MVMSPPTSEYDVRCPSCSDVFRNTSALIAHGPVCRRSVAGMPAPSIEVRERMLQEVERRMRDHERRCPCINGLVPPRKNRCSVHLALERQHEKVSVALDRARGVDGNNPVHAC